ncbi:unnamed protein product [Rotaria magnacalcarata]|uniref:Uncharacterized protein n=1 Tax=Rotaria magnacalcarata TaxID=392030 RepID=A0A819FV23_9BILA|nr:unnamed protein product [Rotaria magnacalcarata]
MAAKVFLRRLNDMSTFNLLQDKLSRLNDTYLSNSCDTNVSRCIDVIELNARVQRELFKLLNLVSAEGFFFCHRQLFYTSISFVSFLELANSSSHIINVSL